MTDVPARYVEPEDAVIPWRDLERQLDGLLLCEPEELERSVGFVRLVRTIVIAPLSFVGVLAPLAAFMAGHVIMGFAASMMAVLMVHSLRHDTQLTTAMEQLRRGELAASESGLRRVVSEHDPRSPQYQRACAYLAAIAWARVDHGLALEWTQRRREAMEQGRMTAAADDRFVVLVSEAQLLALLGRGEDAQGVLDELPDQPPGNDPRFIRAHAVAQLLVAYATQHVQLSDEQLQRWETDRDTRDNEFVIALLAWIYDRQGQRERAWQLAERARRTPESQVHRHLPPLWRWIKGYDPTAQRL